MLDLHRASSNQLKLEISTVSIQDDILKPVESMLYSRGSNFDVVIDCPPNLLIEADRIRLKQVSAGMFVSRVGGRAGNALRVLGLHAYRSNRSLKERFFPASFRWCLTLRETAPNLLRKVLSGSVPPLLTAKCSSVSKTQGQGFQRKSDPGCLLSSKRVRRSIMKKKSTNRVLALTFVLLRWPSCSLHHRFRLFVSRNGHWA